MNPHDPAPGCGTGQRGRQPCELGGPAGEPGDVTRQRPGRRRRAAQRSWAACHVPARRCRRLTPAGYGLELGALRPRQAQRIGQQRAVSLRAVALIPRSRSLTDRGEMVAASASSSCVNPASTRSCRSSGPKLRAGPSATGASSPPKPSGRWRPPGRGRLGSRTLQPSLQASHRSPSTLVKGARVPQAQPTATRATAHPAACDRIGAAQSCGSPVGRHVWSYPAPAGNCGTSAQCHPTARPQGGEVNKMHEYLAWARAAPDSCRPTGLPRRHQIDRNLNRRRT